MSGKCFACSSAFGFFKKEHGCKNCGFAFCSSCLPHKEPVPKHNNQRLPVCINCHLILTGKKKQSDPAKYSPPEALKKRLAALDNPKESQRTAVLSAKSSKGKLSSEDAILENRLLKLKEERKKAAAAAFKQPEDAAKDVAPVGQLPSDQEMADRLANLRGLPSQSQRPLQPFPTEKRSNQQQIDDLLMQISDEVQIDSRSTDDKSTRESMMPEGGGEEEEELGVDEVQRLIRKAAEEAELDAEKATEDLKEDKELWSRLQQLKKERKAKVDVKGAEEEEEEEEEEDEEAASVKIIQKILAENELDKKSALDADEDEDEDEELPWCCICNENATLRCQGCDGDLYCQRCFREGHARFEMTDHTTERYSTKK